MKPIHQIRRDIRGSLSQLANEILNWDSTGELHGGNLRNIAHRWCGTNLVHGLDGWSEVPPNAKAQRPAEDGL